MLSKLATTLLEIIKFFIFFDLMANSEYISFCQDKGLGTDLVELFCQKHDSILISTVMLDVSKEQI